MRGEYLEMLPDRSGATVVTRLWLGPQRYDRDAEMHGSASWDSYYSMRVSTTVTLPGRLSASISVSIRGSGPGYEKNPEAMISART